MPRIPQFTSQTALRGLDTGPLAVAAHRVGIAGQEEGNEISKIGGQINQVAGRFDDATATSYMQQATDWEVQESQRYEDAKQNADPNDPNWLPNYLNDAKSRRAEFDSKFSFYTARGDDYQAKASNQWFETHAKSAMVDHQQAVADSRIATAENRVRGLAIDAAQHPELLDSYLSQVDSDVAPLIGLEHRATESEKLKTGVADFAADAVLAKFKSDPNATPEQADGLLKQITNPDGAFAKHTSPGKLFEIEGDLTKFKTTLSAAKSEIAEQQFPGILTQLRQSGSDAAYQQGLALVQGHMPAGTTPEERKTAEVKQSAMLRELEDARLQGKVTSGLMDRSDNDLNTAELAAKAALGSAQDDAGRRAAQQSLDAIKYVRDTRGPEFNRDPAIYGINHSDAVSASAQAFAKTPNAQTWADYAAKQTAYQKQIKGDGYVPHLSTREMESQVTNAMQSITDQANGTQMAAQTLVKWATVTGGNWPNLAQEWMDRHIINQDQFAAAQLAGKPEAAGLIDPLLSASRMNDKQRYDLHGIGENEARAQAVKVLQPLAVSLANIPNAASTVGAYTTALTHLMQVRGEKQSSQAQSLASKFILDEFDFQDHGTLRIPKTAGDTGAMGKGAERFKDDLGVYEVDVPKSYSGLGAGDQRSNYIRDLQTNAHWYATPDGKGATLYPSPGASRPVTAKGKPIILTWKDLQRVGQ